MGLGPVHPTTRLASIHADMVEMRLVDGQRVLRISTRDRIETVNQSDETMRAGVVTMSHGWGDFPGDNNFASEGACINRLIDGDDKRDPYSTIATMTGMPIRIEPVASWDHEIPAPQRRRVPA